MSPLLGQFTVLLASTPPAAPEREGAFGFEFFLVMIIMIVAFIFLIQRPQAKQREERIKALDTMKKGDKVISAGGIHGTVGKIHKEKGTVMVEVAKGVEMEFNKESITVQPTEKEKQEQAAKNAKPGKGNGDKKKGK